MFKVLPSKFDEKSLDKSSYESPLAFVEDNSLHKARDVVKQLGDEPALIISMSR